MTTSETESSLGESTGAPHTTDNQGGTQIGNAQRR